ncbi:hypothetical protein [Azorhizobium doebereinerae]|uniref:hypothetical protein n=1 Tax=Azorhizobium doebereinerae TaxID=281091 RepID=UPI000422CC49|nr:hypothetical protein [Azorhizobium doebereinerae]
MSVRLQISAMLYLMIQAVLFGAGIIAILSTPLAQQAFTLIPQMTIATALVSVPLAWMLAPRVRAIGRRRNRPLAAGA